MNSTNITVFTCSDAEQVISIAYKITTVLELCFGIFGLIPNILLLSIIWQVIIFPANLRLLLLHQSFILAWISAGCIVKAIYIFTSPLCNFTISIFECKLIELACYFIAILNTSYSLMALVAERLYATVRYRFYDKSAAKIPVMAGLIIAVLWLASMGTQISSLSLPNDQYVPICEGSFLPSTTPISFEISLSLESITICVMIVIDLYNRYMLKHACINRAKFDLSSRFQIEQNVQVNSIVTLSMIVHLLCHVPKSAILLGIRSGWRMPLSTKAWVIRLTYIWTLVYAISHPVLSFLFNVHMKKHLLEGDLKGIFQKLGLNLRKSTNKVHQGQKPGPTHFGYLENLWSTQASQKLGIRKNMQQITVSHQ